MDCINDCEIISPTLHLFSFKNSNDKIYSFTNFEKYLRVVEIHDCRDLYSKKKVTKVHFP